MSQTQQTYYAYLFEAHSIQRYVMQGAKLAEMVGASELLEYLTGASGPLDNVLNQLGFTKGETNDYVFSRRGGGAFFILFREASNAVLLRDLWSLIVAQSAPGLEWDHAIGEGNSQKQAIEAGQQILRQKRNQPRPILPEANPLIRRNPRTGLPAVKTEEDQRGRIISLDSASLAKRKFQTSTHSLLFDKFIETEETKQYWQFPRNLDHKEGEQVFPFKGDNHTIAILHADGNGLGQILMNLAKELEDSKHYAAIFYDLSCKIDQATQQAARRALRTIDEIKNASPLANKKRTLPIRPLILGGDDLTVIIRGDLALDYTTDFLRFFEEETEVELKDLVKKHPELSNNILPDKMTACAGIAFIRSNQPFYLGYQLAESLCAHAKNTSRATKAYKEDGNIPASLAFYHVTTSMIDKYSSVQSQELTVKLDGKKALLSLGAYGIDSHDEDSAKSELPSLTDLKALKELFQEKQLSRGPSRHLLTLMHTSNHEATIAYRRWREVMAERDKSTLEIYDSLCKKLLLNPEHKPQDLPFNHFEKTAEEGMQSCTFLADLSSWIAIEGEQQ